MCEACDAGIGSDPDELNRWLQQRFRLQCALVDRVGWAVQLVENAAGGVEFGYTIGLNALDHPELVLFGAGRCCTKPLLDQLAMKIRRGARLADDDDELTARGGPFRALPLPGAETTLVWAMTYSMQYLDQPVQAVQIVFPDARGVWPWEPGCALPPGTHPFPGTVSA